MGISEVNRASRTIRRLEHPPSGADLQSVGPHPTRRNHGRDEQAVELAGDMRIVEPAGEVRLLPGCKWTEFNCGTNAIGTALALRQPVQIHGSEHFCAGIKRWTCSATVIRDPLDGTVLGVLDVSGLA